jgi:hypothetical protein
MRRITSVVATVVAILEVDNDIVKFSIPGHEPEGLWRRSPAGATLEGL